MEISFHRSSGRTLKVKVFHSDKFSNYIRVQEAVFKMLTVLWSAYETLIGGQHLDEYYREGNEVCHLIPRPYLQMKNKTAT